MSEKRLLVFASLGVLLLAAAVLFGLPYKIGYVLGSH